MANLEDGRSVPVDRLTFGIKVLGALLGVTITICSGILTLGFSVESELGNLRTDIKVMKVQQEARATLEDERSKSLSESVAHLQRLIELQAYEINALKFSLSQRGIPIKYPKE